MPMFDCNFNLRNKKRTLYKWRQAACYATLFCYDGRVEYPAATHLESYYWVDNEERIEISNWFLENFIRPCLAKHIIEGETFKLDVEGFPEDVREKHWIKVTFDLSKISAFDLYVLLAMFRYPQEQPKVVDKMKELVTKKGQSINTAFVNAHIVAKNFGHALLPSTVLYGIVVPKDYSFKKRWEQVPNDILGKSVPMTKGTAKTMNVTSYLEPTR